ncbi:MAG: PH domain-containing protein [Phycisphaerae bacterium]|nr:PH domain-containing protein [Phycisphaerae bacterium]
MSVTPPERIVVAAPALDADRDDSHGIAHLLQPGEIIILLLKPSILFVPLASMSSLLVVALLAFVFAWLSRRFPLLPWSDQQAIAVGVFFGAVRLAWQFLEWATRLYVLTDRRVLRRRGVLRVSVFECRLEQLQQTAVYQSLRERVFFLGTVCFATAGAASFVALWEYVPRPLDVQRTVAEAVERYGRR